MYKLYKIQRSVEITCYITSVWIAYLVTDMSIGMIKNSSYSFEDVFSVLAGVLAVFAFFKIGRFLSNPYKRINELKESNPELVRCYEQDFEKAVPFEGNIWIGEKYLFMRDAKFMVFEYGEINRVRVIERYSRRSSGFELKVYSPDKEASVMATSFKKKRNDVIQMANNIASLAGVILENEL